MSTDQAPSEQAATKKSPLILIIVLVVGLLAGGGAGAMLLGPKFAEPSVVVLTPEEAEQRDRAERQRRDGPAVMHSFENLVLNPAGTGGTRFLMVSAAFELRDSKLADQLKAREVEVRDRILLILGSKTVDELAEISKREQVKEDLRAGVESMFERGSVIEVYLPQFVIQ
jgi:flagellar protein FliL